MTDNLSEGQGDQEKGSQTLLFGANLTSVLKARPKGSVLKKVEISV